MRQLKPVRFTRHFDISEKQSYRFAMLGQEAFSLITVVRLHTLKACVSEDIASVQKDEAIVIDDQGNVR